MSALRKPLMACSPAMARPEERQVGRGERVEPGVAASGFGSWPAQGVQCGDAFAFEWCRRQSVEVAAVGGDADLVVAPEVADALSHLDTTAARAGRLGSL